MSAPVYKVCTEIIVCVGSYNKFQYEIPPQSPTQAESLHGSNWNFLNTYLHLSYSQVRVKANWPNSCH